MWCTHPTFPGAFARAPAHQVEGPTGMKMTNNPVNSRRMKFNVEISGCADSVTFRANNGASAELAPTCITVAQLCELADKFVSWYSKLVKQQLLGTSQSDRYQQLAEIAVTNFLVPKRSYEVTKVGTTRVQQYIGNLGSFDHVTNTLISHLTITASGVISPQLSKIYFGCNDETNIDYSLYLKLLQSRWKADGF
ncbi:hypothetical protein C8R44DRAFT_740828 [Mycena epipterygia]|nr:hypothetical protein C8R44DRAFT_740828 [Mycena epipterygia]